MLAFQKTHVACVRSPLAQAPETRVPAASKPGQGTPKCARYRAGHLEWAWAQAANGQQTAALGGPLHTARRGSMISAEQEMYEGGPLVARDAATATAANAAPSDVATPTAAGCAWGHGGGDGGGGV